MFEKKRERRSREALSLDLQKRKKWKKAALRKAKTAAAGGNGREPTAPHLGMPPEMGYDEVGDMLDLALTDFREGICVVQAHTRETIATLQKIVDSVPPPANGRGKP